MADWHGRISPGFVRAMADLTKKAIRVYCAYSFHAGPNHIASGVGQEKIAEFLGWRGTSATRKVREGLDELQAAGLVSRHSGGFNQPLVVILRGWDEVPAEGGDRTGRPIRGADCTGPHRGATISSSPTGGQLTELARERAHEPTGRRAKVKGTRRSHASNKHSASPRRLRRDRPIVVERQYGAFNGRAGRLRLPPECRTGAEIRERYDVPEGARAEVRQVGHRGQVTEHTLVLVLPDGTEREADRWSYDWTAPEERS